jgi:hypothetical protein
MLNYHDKIRAASMKFTCHSFGVEAVPAHRFYKHSTPIGVVRGDR